MATNALSSQTPRLPVRLTPDRPELPHTRLQQAAAASRLKTTTIYQDQFVKVVSDDKTMSKAQGAALAKKIEDAYKFDTKSLGWTDTAPLSKGQLTVEALTKAGYDKVLGGDSTGVAGVTMGPNLMAVPENLTSSTNPDDDDTIAHELNHVQDFREGGKNIDKVPIYLQEGKAYTIGDSYPIALGEDSKDPVLGHIAQAITKWTAADAQDVMDHFRTDQDENNAGSNGFRDEVMGSLYVQFLKARLNNPDVLPKLSQVVQDVGHGADYDTAFKKQFGISSKDSEAQFVQFVKDTEGKPEERLKGTIWAPYLNQAPATPPATSLAA